MPTHDGFEETNPWPTAQERTSAPGLFRDSGFRFSNFTPSHWAAKTESPQEGMWPDVAFALAKQKSEKEREAAGRRAVSLRERGPA